MSNNEWETFDLNEIILNNINEELKFDSPTDIQKRVLQYVNAKVDLIIQAKTGEGKTLCYALPILNYIMNFYDRVEEKIRKISPVALIIVPTRELGMQVNDHILSVLKDISGENKTYYNIRIANVLGGFAKAKQIRILNKYKPEIIIATPGRLWEILENEESPLLAKLYKLKFLVLDEADRMTETGHFKELKSIIQAIYTKLETVDKKKIAEDSEDEGEGGNKNENILKKTVNKLIKEEKSENSTVENKKIKKALKQRGVNINSADDIEEIDPLEMFADEELIDNFNFNEKNEVNDKEEEDEEEEEEGQELPDEEDEEGEELPDDGEADEELEEEDQPNEEEEEDENVEMLDNEEEEEKEEEDDNKNILDENELRRMKRKEDKLDDKETVPKRQIQLRTFLCSATIEQLHKKKDKRKKKKQNQEEDDEKKKLENLVKNVKFYNKLIYVRNKLTNESTEFDEEPKEVNILPEKLQLDCYKCSSSIKDYYLLHLLNEYKGKTIIVFTNSISHTKKIYSIFSFFDFKLTVLHSKMQQSQRIKNLDRYRKGETNVLFCTDVGARGLDISMVDIVIHYHIPKTTELFIHRSGRTARAAKEGLSISLISEGELNLYKKIMKDIKIKEFAMKTLSVQQMEKNKSLFEYTKNIEKEDHNLKKKNREKQWFMKRASECDLVLDDDEFDKDDEDVEKEKFLNKKRKMIQKHSFKDKKVYHQISTSNIKRTSFMTPELVSKLNSLMSHSNFQDLNLTKAIHEANVDAEAFKSKGKERKKRYMRRRKNK